MTRALVLNSSQGIRVARQLADEVDVLVTGTDARTVAQAYVHAVGLSHIYIAESELYQHANAENTAALIETLGNQYDIIIGNANSEGKNILPRVSGLLNWPMLADVIEVKDKQTFVRPIYAGNALQTIKMRAPKFILTVRPSRFERCETGNETIALTPLDTHCDRKLSCFMQLDAVKSERPTLDKAEIVISGGRGLQEQANFALIERIADKLNAAVGASRAAVDAGWVPNDYQVGQTGKIVAPKLYIAVGISGAIQHLAGMKESKVIVAINTDPEAPIFKIADYGLVADLFEALPQLEEALSHG